MIDDYLQDAVGVIHVGANIGQEMSMYGSRNVLWIEPDPDTFKQLASNLLGSTTQICKNYLITDCDDKLYEFHISSNGGLSSSIFPMKMHLEVADWKGICMNGVIYLESITLNTLFKREGLIPSLYNAMVLDTQGSELLVLQGATEVLEFIKYIKVEVADFESYAGCCMLPDIESFMRAHGYTEKTRVKIASHPKGGSYYDIVYELQV